MTGGSYTCTCNTGFSGDGTTCTDIDECVGGRAVQKMKTVNTAGSFTCTCNWGFSGEGTSCIPQIKYKCNSDDSLYLYNLPEDSYIHCVFAMQVETAGGHMLFPVSDINSTTVAISGCCKDVPIIVTYGAYSGVETYLVHGGNALFVVEALCLEISDVGILHTINNSYTSQCPVVADLISHFTINDNGTANALLYAFKFYEHDSIFLTCDLKVCPKNTSSCTTTCGNRKRSVMERAVRDPRSVFPARINNVLRVADIYSYLSGSMRISGSSTTAEKLMMIILLMTVGILNAREN